MPQDGTEKSTVTWGFYLKGGNMKDLEVIYKSLNEIIPYENNPRDNEGAVEKVKKSIEEFGFNVPILIDKNDIIVAGHTRYKASQELELGEVPCIYVEHLTPAQVRAFRLADNKVSEYAQWDWEKLTEELEEIKTIDMADFGFDIGDIDMDAINLMFEETEETKEKEEKRCPHCGELL